MLFKPNYSDLESRLEPFFLEPNRLFTHIEVSPFLDESARTLYWSATTLIVANSPQDVNKASMGWGGTGSAPSLALSRIKSIAEAFERWALRVKGLAYQEKYGFDLDESSTGLAAHPVSSLEARKQAGKEAVERFCFSQLSSNIFRLRELSEGFFDRFKLLEQIKNSALDNHPGESVQFYMVPVMNDSWTVTLCRWNLLNGRIVAGFACEQKSESAKLKSLIEAHRHRMILDRVLKQDALVSRTEKALLFWAREIEIDDLGNWFQKRIESRKQIELPTGYLIDTAVPTEHEPALYLWRCYLSGTLPAHRCPRDYLYY